MYRSLEESSMSYHSVVDRVSRGQLLIGRWGDMGDREPGCGEVEFNTIQ